MSRCQDQQRLRIIGGGKKVDGGLPFLGFHRASEIHWLQTSRLEPGPQGLKMGFPRSQYKDSGVPFESFNDVVVNLL